MSPLSPLAPLAPHPRGRCSTRVSAPLAPLWRACVALSLLAGALAPAPAAAQKSAFDELYEGDADDADDADDLDGEGDEGEYKDFNTTGRPKRALKALPCTPQNDAILELEGRFTLYFLDAQTGRPIPDASVTFAGRRERTSAEGCVRFPLPKGEGDSLMNATREAHFERDGYATVKAELRFMAESVFFNRFSISRALPAGKLRVVLDWGDKPTDLDAHLVREGEYHISYRDMRSYKDLAMLDRDDRDGFGPETVTIERLDTRAHYRFFVEDYTRSKRLKDSKAHVRVYTEQGLVKTFTVPANLSGDAWQVFELRGGSFVSSAAR